MIADILPQCTREVNLSIDLYCLLDRRKEKESMKSSREIGEPRSFSATNVDSRFNFLI